MIYAVIFIFGLVLGSFYNCVGLRLAHDESIIYPSSHCVKCGHKLNVLDLIPLLSYVFLKGKCRYCKEKISIRYPMFELVTAIAFCLCYAVFNISFELLIALIFVSVLIIITVSDIETFIIPDSALLIGGILILIVQIIAYKTFAFDKLVNATISFGMMYGLKLIGNFLFKKESMGDGDIKLMALIGLVLGIKEAILSLFAAAYLGLPYAIYIMVSKKENKELPFGPFLSLGAMLLLFIDFNLF